MSGDDKISIFLVGIDIEIWIEKHLLTVTISRFSQFIYGDYDIEFGKWIRLISFGGKEDEEWMKHLLILDVHTEFNSRPHVSRDVRLKYLKVPQIPPVGDFLAEYRRPVLRIALEYKHVSRPVIISIHFHKSRIKVF